MKRRKRNVERPTPNAERRMKRRSVELDHVFSE
jgi:hypothetical protein